MHTISGKLVSNFSFGTMQFGGKANEVDCANMYADCRAAGINFFDTAYAYQGGRSEEITGGLIKNERDDIFLATKTGDGKCIAPEVIHREFSESRKRLGQDAVDLLYIHQWDPVTPLETSLGTIAEYVHAGSVRHVGLSNFSAWQVMKAKRIAADLGFEITVLQQMYNLVKRQAEVEVLPMAISEGLVVCPYSPLGGGLLTGKYVTGGEGRLSTDKMYIARYAPDWMHQSATELSALAADVGVHPATLAVAWVAKHKGVFGPIISARSSEQLQPSLAAITYELDQPTYERLSVLSPTPPPANDRLEEVS